MNKPQTMMLLGRIEIEYDTVIDQDRVARWIAALTGQDEQDMNRALDSWLSGPYGHKAPTPADLKREVPAVATASHRDATTRPGGMRSGAGDKGIVIQEHAGVFHMIPLSKVRNTDVDALHAAMKREGTV